MDYVDILWYNPYTGNSCYDGITILSYSFCNTIRIGIYMLCGMEGNMSTSVVLVSGGFDPIHSGHISLLKSAKQIAPLSALAVGLNSDFWLTQKKGKPFMPLSERIIVVRALEMVDNVIEFDDVNGTACDAIVQCLEIYDKVIFANGGDKHNENVPEYKFYKDDDRVIFRWGVGGTGKRQSSSWILKEWDDREKNSAYKPSYYQ